MGALAHPTEMAPDDLSRTEYGLGHALRGASSYFSVATKKKKKEQTPKTNETKTPKPLWLGVSAKMDRPMAQKRQAWQGEGHTDTTRPVSD